MSSHELLSCEHHDLRAKVKGMCGHSTWLMMKSGANSSSGSLAASEASAFRACSGAAAKGAAALAAKLLSVAAPPGLPLLAASIWAPAIPSMPVWHNVDICATTLFIKSYSNNRTADSGDDIDDACSLRTTHSSFHLGACTSCHSGMTQFRVLFFCADQR